MPPDLLVLAGSRALIGGISLGFLWFAIRSDDCPGRLGFGLFVFGTVVWAFATAADAFAPTYSISRTAYNFLFAGAQIVAGGWLLLTLEVTRDYQVRRRDLVLLAAWVLCAQLLLWTNASHGFVLGPDTALRSGVLLPDYEIGFWLNSALAYLLIVSGTLLLAHEVLMSRGLRRKQTALLSVAIIPALTANLVSLFDWWFAPFDLAPYGFVITSVLLAVAIFRLGFLDLVPVAHRTAISETANGIITFDRRRRVVDCNGAARRMFGIDGTGIGLPATEFFGSAAVDLSASGDQEVLIPSKDGDRHYLISTTAIGNDRTEGWVVIAHDITARRQREDQLRAKNERLDSFASLVAHDLKNPLAVAKGHLSRARDDCDSDHLSTTDSALDRMDTMLDDMLELAKAGQDVGELEAVDLEAVVDLCRHDVETEGATIHNEAHAVIRADRSRLRQLLENLFRNAIDHGDGAVQIRVGDLPDGFYVEDNGPGIPPDQRAEVFEAGYSTTEAGTGFGLSIVGDIAEAHGWTVDIESSETGGARFEITDVDFEH